MEQPHKILVLTEDGDLATRVWRCLTDRRFELRHYRTASDALNADREWRPELLICDFEIGGQDVSGLLEALHRQHDAMMFIVMLPSGRTLEVMRELRSRVAAFLTKPFSDDDLLYYVKAAFGRGDAPQNRREHHRYLFTVDTHLLLINPFDHSESRPVAALMRDVSRSGMSLIVRQLVPVPTMVKLVLNLTDQSHPVSMLAKSISCMLTQIPGVYRLGIKFIGLLPRQLEDTIGSLNEALPVQSDIYMGKSFKDAVQEWLATHTDTMSGALTELATEVSRRENEHEATPPKPIGEDTRSRSGNLGGPVTRNGFGNGRATGNGHGGERATGH